MPKFGIANLGARLQIDLTAQDIAVTRYNWRGNAELLAHQELGEQASSNPQDIVVRLTALLAGFPHRGMPASLVVADAWTRLYMVTPPRNAMRFQDLQAAAAMRFTALYGDTAATWQLQADWRVGSPFLVCAMPQVLLAALRQAAMDSKLHVVSIRPHFVSAWNRHHSAMAAGAWFGAVQGDSLMVGATAAKRQLQAVRRIVIPSNGRDRTWIEGQVARMALQLGLPAPGLLQLAGNHERYWRRSASYTSTLSVRNLDRADSRDREAPSLPLSPSTDAPSVPLAEAGQSS